MESDLNLYLECLLHPNNQYSLKETLRDLANFISTNGNLKDNLRDKKGLHVLLKLLMSTNDMSVKQAALFTMTCAVDSCVSSQNLLIQKGIVGILSNLIKIGNSTLFRPVTLLLSFLSQGNSLGQNKVRHAGVINVLTQSLRDNFPITEDKKQIWNSILTCLSSLVNNPRNSINQEMCIEIIPMCLAALRDNIKHTDLVISICSFIRLCLSDNDTNQIKFGKIGCLRGCFELLERLETTDSPVAWSLISLINSAPKALLESETEQIRCVNLLLRWIGSGGAEDIPCGLHTLALAVENSPKAKAALISHRAGMSTILRCMTIGDESAKKTAQLLMQILFYGENSQESLEAQPESSSEIDSDLESASYEIFKAKTRAKQATIKLKSNNKQTLTQKRNVTQVQRTAKRVKRAPSFSWNTTNQAGCSANQPAQKPTVTHRETPTYTIHNYQSISCPPANRKSNAVFAPTKTPILERHDDVHNPKFTFNDPCVPQTPQATPMIQVHDIDTPIMCTERPAKLKETNSLAFQTVKPAFQSFGDTSKNGVESIASIIEQKMDKKLHEFFERFEKVLSTNVSIKSDSSMTSLSKIDQVSQTDDIPAQLKTPTKILRQFLSTNIPAKIDSNIIMLSKVDTISSAKNTTTHKTDGCGENVVCQAVVNQSTNATPQQRALSCKSHMSDETDTSSIVTHISQTSFLKSFFDINPDLLPTCKLPGAPHIVNDVVDETKPLNDVKTSKFRISDEHDSGYDNVSLISSAITVDRTSWPKMNLSQRYFEDMQSTCKKEKNIEPKHLSTPLLSNKTQSKITREKPPGFTEQEIANICKGVQSFGRCWSVILVRFNFHAHRTPADLRKKYCQIRKFLDNKNERKMHVWTKGELRRLKRGVYRFGTEWRKIIKYYHFKESRTVKDLCNQWIAITNDC